MKSKNRVRGFDDRKYETRLLLESVKAVLIRNGFTFEILNYPTSYRERSIDIVAVRGDEKFLIRIRLNVKNINKEEVNDLTKAASAIDAIPVIVNNEETYENVVHEREGIYVMSDRTFNKILRGSSDVFITFKKGEFFIKINPKKLEQLRAALGLSLGELALRAGVSRRMVFDYERGVSNVTLEVAERLVEILGEDIIEPITIESLKSNMVKSASDSDCECTNLLNTMGLDFPNTLIYRISRSAPDYIVSVGNGDELKFVVNVDDISKVTIKDAVRKILESEKLTRLTRSEIIALLRRDLRDVIIDELSTHKVNINRITVLSRG